MEAEMTQLWKLQSVCLIIVCKDSKCLLGACSKIADGHVFAAIRELKGDNFCSTTMCHVAVGLRKIPLY